MLPLKLLNMFVTVHEKSSWKQEEYSPDFGVGAFLLFQLQKTDSSVIHEVIQDLFVVIGGVFFLS